MTRLGCPINASAIYKIEKADPPRRITVDELVGFSRAFEISVEDLLLPPEIASRTELRALFLHWEGARNESGRAAAAEESAWSALREFVDKNPEISSDLETILTGWAEYYFPDHVPQAATYWKWKITDADEDEQAWEAAEPALNKRDDQG
jgi:hypothetical protein